MKSLQRPRTDVLGRTDLQKQLDRIYCRIIDLVSEGRNDEATQLFNKLNDGRKRYFLERLSKADEHIMEDHWQVQTYKLLTNK